MKTIEELNTLKNEVETLNKKLAELTEEELEQVVGGGSATLDVAQEVAQAIFGGTKIEIEYPPLPWVDKRYFSGDY